MIIYVVLLGYIGTLHRYDKMRLLWKKDATELDVAKAQAYCMHRQSNGECEDYRVEVELV